MSVSYGIGARFIIGLLVMGGALAGCAHKKLDALAYKSQFPTREQLVALAAKPPPKSEAAKADPVDRWEWSVAQSPGPDQEPWVALMNEVIARRPQVKATQSMACAAEHLGRIVIERRTAPDERVQRFVLGHCGASFASVTMAWLAAEESSGTPVPKLVEAWGEDLRKHYAEILKDAPTQEHGPRLTLGTWFGRHKKHAVVVIVAGEERVELAQVSAPGGQPRQVTIRGRVLTPGSGIHAWINHGSHGVAACETDPRTMLPEFSVSCPMAPADKAAWVDLTLHQRGRLLANAVGSVLVKEPVASEGEPAEGEPAAGEPAPAAQPALVYERPREAGPPARDVPTFTTRALARLNQVRAEAKLPPLTIAARQSMLNQQLVPYFESATGAEHDVIALGLLAGHDVSGGVIRDGEFFAMSAPTIQTPEAWVDACLERPVFRHTLLDADANKLALGALLGQSNRGVSALVTTYTLFGKRDLNEERRKVLASLHHQRLAAGREKPVWARVAAVQEQADRIAAERIHPEVALESAVSRVANAYLNRRVGGLYVVTQDLESIEYPPELVQANSLLISIGITHVQLPGMNWGVYIVLVTFITDSGGRV